LPHFRVQKAAKTPGKSKQANSKQESSSARVSDPSVSLSSDAFQRIRINNPTHLQIH
jgi:hypothetical protein